MNHRYKLLIKNRQKGGVGLITIARIDERLIHGQVAHAWTVAYKTDVIMVIDDEISQDKFQTSLLHMACPTGVKCLICDESKAPELLNKYDNHKIFIVVKHPKTLLNLVRSGTKMNSINVGGLYFSEGRRKIAKTIYLDDEMISIFNELHQLGVKLETRTTPTDPEIDLMQIL